MTGVHRTDDVDLSRGLHALAMAEGDQDTLKRASRFALAMLTPGCFAAGQAGLAVRLLCSEGFLPVYTQFVDFDAEQITRVWCDSLEKMKPARRTIVYELLESGESLMLLLRDVSDDDRSASERLAELKGHSDPTRCRSGSLRVRLGAANRVINLIHSADSTANLVRELAILLNADDLSAAWRAAAGHRSATLAVNPVLLDIGTRWCGNSLTHVCVIVRARLVGALVAAAQHADGWQIRCEDELRWVREQPLKDPGQVAAGYRQTFPRPMLARAYDHRADLDDTAGARLTALRLLDALQYGDPVDLERLRETLARSRCVLDPWEWVVLASTAAMSAGDE